MTPAQYQAWLRQQQQKRNDAIRRYNAEVDRVNRANKAAYEAERRRVNAVNAEIDRVNRHNRNIVEEYNREIRNHNNNRRIAIDRYNNYVRAHNAKVQRDRNELQRQINALRSRPTASYIEVRNSTYDLADRYNRIEQQADKSEALSELLVLSEREASNSAAVAEAFTSDDPISPEAQDSGILEYLAGFSQDLCDRWTGAVFSLNPSNPDAARHFCTSVREIFTEILDNWADNKAVLSEDANCDKTPNGTPSRRAKIQYLLKKKGANSPEMLGFVEKDIEDILQLFKVFNEATHGTAGKHGYAKLLTIRQRVEGGIMFLASVAL